MQRFHRKRFKTISDNPAEIQSWYLMRIQNDIVSPAQTVESIKVTWQQIIDAANSFKLDGVYVLTSNTQETDNPS